MSKHRHTLRGRLGSGSSSSLSATVRDVLRNLGSVVLVVHAEVQSALLKANRLEDAEALNDWMKPLGDMLAHFDFDVARETTPEGDDHGTP